MLADLAVNHAERQIILRGFSVDRVEHDYGFDLVMTTYDADGMIENGQVMIQVKGQDKSPVMSAKESLPFRLDRRDLDLWLREPEPVILAVYDGSTSEAYWLYVQAHFEAQGITNPYEMPRTVTVHVPLTNKLDPDAISELARLRDNMMAQIMGRIRHCE